jgi:hypothetical protein
VTFLVVAATAVIIPGKIGPLISGLFFAVHPVHVEAVANITGRAELLGAMFYLLGFLAYAKGARRESTSWGWIFVATVMTVLSMLSKEPGITLPLICAVWDAAGGGGGITFWDLVAVWGTTERKDETVEYHRGSRVKACCHRLAAMCFAISFIAYCRFEWTGGDPSLSPLSLSLIHITLLILHTIN